MLLCDYAEEHWPSMDLCAAMLFEHLHRDYATLGRYEQAHVTFRQRFCRFPVVGRWPFAQNADRFLNRFWDYPRYLRHRVNDFDLFHVCDHSYSQLIHELPADRTGVFCHDLDTFRCLLQPKREPRPRWFRAMARRILTGFQKAAVVFHTTNDVRREIERFGLIDPTRLIQAPLGIAPEFVPTSSSDSLPISLNGMPYLLHVGSCIPRKRIDVLLDVFAGVSARRPGLKLVKVGGVWTSAQREQASRLGIGSDLIHLTRLDRSKLAGLYRHASATLIPSEAEGFGLPIIEALACGEPVVTSDLPVIREVAGAAAMYCPVADVPTWVDTVCRLLEDPFVAPCRSIRLEQAKRYSWATHAQIILSAYLLLTASASRSQSCSA
jgi:glycosyltransferase involved in cell wall biosynthesis